MNLSCRACLRSASKALTCQPLPRPCLSVAVARNGSFRSLSTTSQNEPMDHPTMQTLRRELTETLPCFGVRGDEIEVLVKPEDFHQRLLKMIERAKRKILISTLYIGEEQIDLIGALRSALLKTPHLRLTLILDLLRSTRSSHAGVSPPSPAHLILPLIQEFPDRVEAFFYRSPNLKGMLERVVPRRFDEGWGLWHCKYYAVDDEVVLTGANLSNSYFTNRQDRYYHLSSQPTLLSYLASLTRLYSQYCYRLVPAAPASSGGGWNIPLHPPQISSPQTEKNEDGAPKSLPAPAPATAPSLIWSEPQLNPRHFSAHAHATLSAFQRSWRASVRARRVDVDTWIWPMVQAGVLGVREEENGVGKVLKGVGSAQQVEKADSNGDVLVDLTSGYFGLYKKYKKAVLESKAGFRIVAASPQANGFYKSAGVSGLIPEAYTLLETRFHEELVARGRDWEEATGKGIELSEWGKEGWTYHAKGIWLTPKSEPPHTHPRPFATLIGSTNLSTRSLNLDTELSFLMMTSCPTLRKGMAGELGNIRENISRVGKETWADPERKVRLRTKVLVGLGVEGML